MQSSHKPGTARGLATIAAAAIAAVAIGQISLTTVGCRRAPDLPDLFQMSDYRKPFDVRLQSEISAPIIVLGRVEGSTSVGRPRRSVGDPGVMVQLTRIGLQIEQVLKGTLGGDRLDFYYYTYSRENDRDLGIPRFRPIPDDRRMFFLQGFDGGYRSVGDVNDYTLAVKSGYHSRDFCGGKAVGCCIAEILLTPGEGYDPSSFAHTVGQAAAVAKVLCSQDRALELVQVLERSPDVLVSQEATEVLRPWRRYQQFP